MKPLPLILVREFGGPDFSYRIPLRRAQHFWGFLEHIHNTFNKPWERYNSHLHLDNGLCDGRVSPSEWDAGSYFEAEFLVEGRLTLYAHFEEVELRIQEPDFKKEDEGEAWRWGWHGPGDTQDKWYDSQPMYDDGFDTWDLDLDPYPPFPDALPLETPIDRPNYAPSTNKISLPHTNSQTTPSPIPATEIITIHDSNTTRYLDNGIIIGRAKPECCRDPKVRPVARAILNSRGSVYVYICGKYAKRTLAAELVQIGIKDVDFSEEFEKAPSEEKRLLAIRHRLQEKLAIKQQLNATDICTTSDLPSSPSTKKSKPCRPTTAESEGIIIGRAVPASCRNPEEPPIVRATLNSVGAVIAFIPAEDSLRPFAKGKAQLQMKNVAFNEEFAALDVSTRSKVIREKIQEVMGKSKSEEVSHEQGEEEERLVDVESS